MGLPDLTVDSDTRLDSFLLRHRTQPWRVPLLVAYGGVRVFRGKGGGEVRLNDAQTPLKANDTVRLVTPLPSACATALQKEANTNWRDYAIVPGTTPFDDRLRKFIKVRTNTVLIKDVSMFSLAGFLDGIATSAEITHPIRRLIVVGHGNVEGHFRIALYPAGAGDEVQYEDLEDAVTGKKLLLDVSLMMPRPVDRGGTIPPILELLGCSIGDTVPYMTKFKQALGGRVTLIAPKYFVVGATLAHPPGEAAYMAYRYNVFLPAAVRDRAALVDQYVAKSDRGELLREDGKSVPKSVWEAWLPRHPNASPNLRVIPEIPNLVVLPVFPGTADAPRRFDYERKRHLFHDQQLSLYLATDTGKEADRKNAVKDHLRQTSKFYLDSHPFPMYVRFGYPTMDAFMDGWTWQFAYDKKTKTLTFEPVRDEYRLLQPITRVATNTLIMNYYPTGLVPPRFKSQMPIEMLQVNDPFFFGVY